MAGREGPLVTFNLNEEPGGGKSRDKGHEVGWCYMFEKPQEIGGGWKVSFSGNLMVFSSPIYVGVKESRGKDVSSHPP